MSVPIYTEPLVSFLVLDYQRPEAAALCLRSIRLRCKLADYRVIYCHNGAADYPHQFLKDGLIDELIMPRANLGLGLGTRALYSACFSPLAITWQVDQVMGRPFEQCETDALLDLLPSGVNGDLPRGAVASVSLAGPVCGNGVFSERAGVMRTEVYRAMEHGIPLGAGGAGPWHHLPWREGAIQQFYRERSYIHLTDWRPLAIDNGRDAVRQNPDGSVWRHEPDTKALTLISGPVKERYVYPKLTDAEWTQVLDTQSWPPGQIPEQERKDSFTVPQWH